MQPRSTRARRHERGAVLDLLAEAYADEALTREEYDERTDRARTAVTTADLDALIADLRIDDEPVRVPPSFLTRWAISAGAVLGVLGLGWALAFALTGDDETPSPAPPAATVDEAPSVAPGEQSPEPGGEPETAAADPLSSRGIDRFLRRYEARYGDTLAYQVVLRPERIDFVRPAGAPGRSLARAGRWTADGFSRLEPARDRSDEPGRPVDLAEVDVRALVRNLDRATDSLGLRDAEVAHVSIASGPDRSAQVTIHARDDLGSSASLVTTLSGKRLPVPD